VGGQNPRRVVVTTEIAAPIERVWRALTVPEEVSAWDHVAALDVPSDYPRAGQHARWRSRIGPVPLTLHDRIRAVEPPRRMAASIDVGFVHIEEEYRLSVADGGGTLLVSDNEVRARLPGLGRLAARTARRGIAASMARLKTFCERGAIGGETSPRA
jgi:uncharacterized protein YndB with AHSA1/START domain